MIGTCGARIRSSSAAVVRLTQISASADAWERVEAQVLGMLRQQFRPEFLNRIDDVVVFKPLGEAEIAEIVDLQLAKLDTMLSARKLTLTLTPEAKELLVGEGYDSAFGARPLKRAIQRMVQNPLALALLDGTLHDGDTVIASPGAGQTLVFTRQSKDAGVSADEVPAAQVSS